METERTLTVLEALKRPLFREAQVAAGEQGLNREIRWVHILETPSPETLIHGDEMILTTGVGFHPDAGSSVKFLENLIRQKAACLCIEIGAYFPSVPPLWIELAERHTFPLILFPNTVRFVDITQDLHSLILDRHHAMLKELERLSREFQRLTLGSHGLAGVLKLLHKHTQSQFVYLPSDGKPLFYPAAPQEEQAAWLRLTLQVPEEPEARGTESFTAAETDGWHLIRKPIVALDRTWAYLLMISRRKPNEYDHLLLDSAYLAIAQELLRSRHLEERRLFSENLWVDELLSNPQRDDTQLKALIGPDFKKLNEWNYRVCLIEIENGYDGNSRLPAYDWESLRLHLTMILRAAFEKHGFRPYITLKNNRLAIIALDIQAKPNAKSRLRQSLEAFLAMRSDEKLKDLRLIIGAGKPYSGLKNAYTGYQEAVQALSLHASLRKPILFYEELGVLQLLLLLNDGRTLQAFIRDYLGPLIDHDETKGSKLLPTLKAFLDNDGSKQIAAQKLYIVRQSLYYRLEKIAELLGRDFMAPDNRMAIQVALLAYQMLEPGKSGDRSETPDKLERQG
ncbi:PucR family transcriptional regulator [Cohnella sp. CFH 77786]|uniref:PucR family transcriptional regulator n=1 Tax=Cohnella sp. CFH 77786 TaxID=2662265 RepID=UPI001C60FA8B|nr:PucR family transcriptional regulator ligand-binding domain-containing protein [Cohnella sp. CFH 77786]MBW5445526.1 PucR family transcriptional regulator [Cohnella sp. CFH 77786]